ncbi:MAG: hypothetical protein GX759_06360 [Thermoanaerobacterales bacterium]|jgi:hypothetical protein|nr:hypothetical protein [Thermoanaerobacterales bacterium]
MTPKKRLFVTKRTTGKHRVNPIIVGKPSPREVESQVAQLESNQPGTRKDVKIKMDNKLN